VISDKTLQTLEFDKILDRLEEFASFSAGKELVLALRPSTSVSEVQARLDETSEARLLLDTRPSTHLGGAHDVRAAVRRAEVGAVLAAEELLEIGGTLGASARIRSAVLRTELEIPWLRSQAEAMTENRPLVETLEQTFSERGEILDSASPALRRIRSDVRSAQGRLLDRLNAMVTSAEYRTALQESIVTMRNGRYVVPVKQDARTKVPGVVHDQSASGHTLFVEPLAVTELNNRLKELELAEQREIERILAELSARVAAQAPALHATVTALAAVDGAFARARYAATLRAHRPAVNADGSMSLVNARHPLLHGDVVPITVPLGEHFRILVITGPNTGGKTVALKTVGLLGVMAQAGMHIPADDGSIVNVFDRVFADIGDEQSIEQSLSTFSSHVRNIIEMLPEVDDSSLVLLDELGAGTDPAEGSALARALLTTLLESGARGVVTTHYSELKTFAHEQAGVENASVEFNVQTLSPTYRLVVGLAGRSQALAIARHLGMPQRILDRARQNVSTGAVRVEKLLSQIQWERAEIGRLYQRARELHEDARKLRDRVQAELRSLAAERETVLDEAREEAAAAVREMRARLREIESESKAAASRRELRAVRSSIEAVQEEAAAALGASQSSEPSAGSAVTPGIQPLRSGATVQVLSLGQEGTVTSVQDGEAEVQLGQFKMRLPVDDLRVLSSREARRERAVEFRATRAAPPAEIDVRGWRADDVVREIDQYLHDSYLHGQNTLRIIHGKGTGALRRAIREQLDEHPLVGSHQSEDPKQGGDGVTVVRLLL
jgi:DNA mismatch repair protein MutS2